MDNQQDQQNQQSQQAVLYITAGNAAENMFMNYASTHLHLRAFPPVFQYGIVHNNNFSYQNNVFKKLLPSPNSTGENALDEGIGLKGRKGWALGALRDGP